MMRQTRRFSDKPARFLLVLLILALLPCGAVRGDAAQVYIENEWNYVDVSMDVAGGIPADAAGRLARIRAAGKLTVATEPYFPPQEFIDDTREGQARYVGADMELARLIAERMGVELEIVPMEFAEVLDDVADGKYDLAISALAFTSGRAAVLEMSKGYYYTTEPGSSCILIRSECAGEIDEVEDLAERDIVAQSGSLQETMAAESIVFYRKFRRLATVDDVYQAVMTGKADAGIVDMENAHTYIEDHPDCGLAIVEDVIFTLQPQYQGDRVAAKKGEIQLICFVNGVIDEVLDSGLYNDWFEQYARYGQD